jgi:anionic cell wall polymer biosynthesis LytR-Cps2A-Psr (LCP) family protein
VRRVQGGGRRRDRDALGDRLGEPQGFGRALGLTVVSIVLWGFAHLWVGRRATGLALLAVYWLLVATAIVAVTGFRQGLLHVAVRPDLLTGLTVGALALGLVWVTVVIRSYQISRPDGELTIRRAAANTTVGVLCIALCLPFGWVARYTQVYQDTLTSIFQSGDGARQVDANDPWAGRRRVNVLLLGGDAARNRDGVRTDSMTLASVDTHTGDTVLLSLPRNLEHFPMPSGPARARFPFGFSGDDPQNPGLLNEVYEYAEGHPEIVPGVPKGRRGPALVSATISEILGQQVDYYILVDMFGFANIIDAMGGVKMKVDRPIPYGQRGDVIQPGYRTLPGKEALWYGRSRNDSDDYTRMGRQKCLLRAIAKQANPQRVLTRFEKLATATRRAISTDIPRELLPALIDLSSKVKGGAKINSLQFVPPLINTVHPDFMQIRRSSAKAISDSEEAASASAAPPGRANAAPPTNETKAPTPSRPGTPDASPGRPPAPDAQSLDATCPS